MPHISYETFRQMLLAWDVSAYFFCRNVRRHVFAETSFAETSVIHMYILHQRKSTSFWCEEMSDLEIRWSIWFHNFHWFDRISQFINRLGSTKTASIGLLRSDYFDQIPSTPVFFNRFRIEFFDPFTVPAIWSFGLMLSVIWLSFSQPNVLVNGHLA